MAPSRSVTRWEAATSHPRHGDCRCYFFFAFFLAAFFFAM